MAWCLPMTLGVKTRREIAGCRRHGDFATVMKTLPRARILYHSPPLHAAIDRQCSMQTFSRIAMCFASHVGWLAEEERGDDGSRETRGCASKRCHGAIPSDRHGPRRARAEHGGRLRAQHGTAHYSGRGTVCALRERRASSSLRGTRCTCQAANTPSDAHTRYAI